MVRVAELASTLCLAMLRTFLPPLCLSCGRVLEVSERWLCTRCLDEIMGVSQVRTRLIQARCSCPIVLRFPLPYTPVVARLIMAMKYNGKPGVSALLAPLVAGVIGDIVCDQTAIVPVPLHHSRKRERGYNQSEILAQKIGNLVGLPVITKALKRRKNTVSQTKLSPTQRKKNVIGAFSLCDSSRLERKRVLVVDDVATSGATIGEVARTLVEAGAREVMACVVASS